MSPGCWNLLRPYVSGVTSTQHFRVFDTRRGSKASFFMEWGSPFFDLVDDFPILGEAIDDVSGTSLQAWSLLPLPGPLLEDHGCAFYPSMLLFRPRDSQWCRSVFFPIRPFEVRLADFTAQSDHCGFVQHKKVSLSRFEGIAPIFGVGMLRQAPITRGSISPCKRFAAMFLAFSSRTSVSP